MGFCFTQCRPEKGPLRNPFGDISISKYLLNIFDSCTFLKVEQTFRQSFSGYTITEVLIGYETAYRLIRVELQHSLFHSLMTMSCH